MTFKEAKERVYMLLDEYGDGSEIDEDIELKLPAFFDTAQKKLAQIKRLSGLYEIERVPGQADYPMPADFMELREVWKDGRVATKRFRWRRGCLMIPESERGVIEVEYDRIPAPITEETPEDYVFEIAEDAAQCMPYFVAANCLASDLVQDSTTLLGLYQLMVQDLVTEQPGEGVRFRQTFYRG